MAPPTTTRFVISFALFLVIFLPYQLQTVSAANVLAVLPSVWKSHYLFGRRLLELLVAQQQNHSVTIISPYSAEDDGIALSNIREIRIEGLMENWLEMGMSFDAEHMRAQTVMERFTRLIYAGTTNVDLLLSDAQVRKLLTSGERFDLLVVDLFLSDALLGLAYYYGIPTVAISPTGANSWLNNMMGNPQSSALDPSNFLPYTEHMNLSQRTVNTLMSLFERMTYNFFHMIAQQMVYTKHFEALVHETHGLIELPHYRDLTKNISLALINTQPVLHYPRAYLPNILEIGGAHLQPGASISHAVQNERSLSSAASTINNNSSYNYKHLQTFIESASSGVVYISFGANVRTDELPPEKLETLLDVFSYLNDFNFLLKWESEGLESDLPKNVMINSWLPQEAILAHPNVKVFVSACGLLSTFESIAGQTPILAIPILPEQEVLALRLQQHGVALLVSYDNIAYDAMLLAIRELTFNVSYQQKMTQLSERLQTGVAGGVEKALHHIDLILKTAGADFLKSHANLYNFWRAELFDVLAIIGLGLICILAVPFIVICCILRKSYYSQAAAESKLPNNCRLTLKAVGRVHSYSGGDYYNATNNTTAGGVNEYECGEPLRRTRSANSLSTHHSSSSESTSSTTSSISLTSYDLTPTLQSPPQNVTPLQVFINQKTTQDSSTN